MILNRFAVSEVRIAETPSVHISEPSASDFFLFSDLERTILNHPTTENRYPFWTIQ